MTGSTARISRSSDAASLGRSARVASPFRIPAATEPPTRRNALAWCSITSRSVPDRARAYAFRRMDTRERHLRLLTETIEAVNSTLDLQEVLSLVATKVADALHTDACFVYLYDERADELVLRATRGTPIDEMSRRPRMRPGEGITGAAAAARPPGMLEAQAPLDPRFKTCPNLPEDEYQSILAVPITTRDGTLEGALNVRTREPRPFTDD